MQSADRAEFLKVLNGLAAIKPGAKLIPEALDMWWLAMESWTIDDFKQAATHLARSIEFMPSPFHFEQLRKAGRPLAGEAWARVLEYVRKDWSPNLGSRASVGDPAIDRAVHAVGGYEAIAHSNIESTPFLERRFAEHFETIQGAADTREAVPQIAAPEYNNRVTGPTDARSLLGRWTPPQDNSHETKPS